MSTLSFDKKLLESTTDKNGVTVLKYTDKDAYFNGTDLPKKQILDVASYNKKYCEEATIFAKDQALDVLKKNKDINTIKVELPWGYKSNGKLTVAVNREKTYPGIKDHPPVTKSTLQVKIKEPAAPGKTFISGLEDELTKALLK